MAEIYVAALNVSFCIFLIGWAIAMLPTKYMGGKLEKTGAVCFVVGGVLIGSLIGIGLGAFAQ